jgi:hypothetical protein
MNSGKFGPGGSWPTWSGGDNPIIRDPQPLTGDTVPCPECREDLDNHHPCGEPGCGCWCMDPDTPAHMKRPPEVVGS